MRYIQFGMLALTAVALAVLVPGNGLTQPVFNTPAAVPALLASASAGSVPAIQVKGGHGHGRFRGGIGLGFWPGWYGSYGYNWPYGYYGGSYLDTPSRTCVWNGYEYTCYNFPSDQYLY